MIPTLADMPAKAGHLPKRLIADNADNACGADWLRRAMEGVGSEQACPHHRGGKMPPTQGGRLLRG